MSDLAWVAFIIIVYMMVIKPMMQGILKQPPTSSPRPKTNQTATPKQHTKDGEYVDYEEVK